MQAKEDLAVRGGVIKGIANDSAHIEEGGYSVRVITEASELSQAFQLRHRIFCEELGWVPETIDGMEIDEYDINAIPFGVFDPAGNLRAYLRLILTNKPFMLKEIFGNLIGNGHVLRRDTFTAEVSRLCVAPEARKDSVSGNFGAHNISMFLYKGVYHWCLENDVRYLYLVVEEKIFRLLNAKGILCSLIGEPQSMPDGVNAVAGIIDWRDVEKRNAALRPKMIDWFTRALPGTPGPSLSPLHESGLPHPVSA